MTEADGEFTARDADLDPAVRDMEAPTADVVEQSIPANPREVPSNPRIAFEADEYDAIEQNIVVDFDDEDY